MILSPTDRAAARTRLLDRLRQLQHAYADVSSELVRLATGTGCTSLVNTVRGLGRELDKAYARVERVTTDKTKEPK